MRLNKNNNFCSILIVLLLCGFMYMVGSTIVAISTINTEKAAKIILGNKVSTQKGPLLDEKRVKEFVKSFEGKRQ